MRGGSLTNQIITAHVAVHSGHLTLLAGNRQDGFKEELIMKSFWVTLFTLAMISLSIWGIMRGVAYLSFKVDCSDYLKRAADSNSIELAQENLKKATSYLEQHGTTSGIVSIILKQPSNDIGFFYKNLKASEADLAAISSNLKASSLEKSNVLMKLRETLLDAGKEGDKITKPMGIEIYPNNLGYFLWAVISSIAALISGAKLYFELY